MGIGAVTGQMIMFVVGMMVVLGVSAYFLGVVPDLGAVAGAVAGSQTRSIRDEYQVSSVFADLTRLRASMRNVGDATIDVNELSVFLNGVYVSDSQIVMSSGGSVANQWAPLERLQMDINGLSMNHGEKYTLEVFRGSRSKRFEFKPLSTNRILPFARPLTATIPYQEGWQPFGQVLSLSCAVLGTLCDTTYYRVNGGDWVVGGTVTLSADGNHRVDYYSEDVWDLNEYQTNSVWVAVDTSPPEVGTTSISGFSIYADYIKGTGTVTGGTVTDAHSGVDTASCEYTENGSDWNAADWVSDHCQKSGVAIVDGAPYAFNTRASDNVENVGAGTATASYTGDVSAPATADDAPTSWSGTENPVTLSCTDTYSGCATTYYRVDAGSWQSGSTVTLVADGNRRIDYYSVDNLSNTESQNEIWVPIDRTDPVVGETTLSGFTVAGSYITGSGTVVGGAATDATSGVDTNSCAYTENGSDWSDATWNSDHCQKAAVTIVNGVSYRFNTRISDLVPNTGSGTATSPYTGDTLPPATTDDAASGWQDAGQSVALSCTDAGSGCATTYYRVDAGDWQEGVLFSVSADGNHRIDYYSADAIGFDENVNSAWVAVDTTAPSVGATALSGFTIYGGYIGGSGTVVGGAATDATSGIDSSSCQYTSNGTSWASASWNTDHCERALSITAHGVTYAFNTRASDRAGNVGAGTAAASYTGDAQAPVSTDDAPAGPAPAPLTINLGCTDAGSGCSSTTYTVDGGAPQSGSTVFIESAGEHTVTYYSTDRVGNVESAHLVTVTLTG